MAVVIRSGLVAAVNAVRAFLTEHGVTAVVELGWNRRTRQTNQGLGGANRVIFTPSGDDAGAGGAITKPRFAGDRPIADAEGKTVATVRELVNWDRRLLVSVWAADPTRAEDEASQIEATETLFEWVVRALHSAPGAFANLQWGETRWTPPLERAFGLELRAAFTFRHPIFDQPNELVYPDGAAVGRAGIAT